MSLLGPSIRYEDFRAANQVFAADGGPWTVTVTPPTTAVVCSTINMTWCGPSGYCLACETNGDSTAPSVKVAYSTRISFALSQYATPQHLNYTWSFWPLYIGSEIPQGSQYSMNTQFNIIDMDDHIVAGNFSAYSTDPWVDNGPVWNNDSVVSHRGAVPLIIEGTTTTISRGYLTMVISYFINVTNSNEKVRHITKGIDFKITTPTLTNLTDSTLSGGSTIYSVEPAVGSSTPTPIVQSQMSSGTIAGTALGIVALFAFIAALLFLRLRHSRVSTRDGAYLEKKAKNLTPYPPEKNQEATSTLYTVVQTNLPFSKVSFPPPKARTSPTAEVNTALRAVEPPPPIHAIPTGAQAEEPPILTPTSTILVNDIQQRQNSLPAHPVVQEDASSTLREEAPPPNYDASNEAYDPYDMPPVSQVLALFAENNRGLINEDLEARLAAAGYVPTDDPDALSEEEWRNQHNVTKLELVRLRILYNRGVISRHSIPRRTASTSSGIM